MTNIILLAVLPTLFQTAVAELNSTMIYTNQKQPENKIIFERLEFVYLNKSLIVENWTSIREIAWNVVKMNISFTVTQPLNEFWIRGILFKKFNTYRKFLIDITFDACGFLNGTDHNPAAQYALENYFRLKESFKLNVKLQCPIFGILFGGVDRVNVSELVFPLLPAGRYRADGQMMTKKNGTDFCSYSFLLSSV